MFNLKNLAVSALLATVGSQLPAQVDAAAALTRSIPDNDTTTTYSSLNPQEYAVKLSYVNSDGKEQDIGCDSPSANAACMTTLQASQSSITVKYETKPDFPVNSTSTVRIQMCYGPENIVDRPWRKFNDVISKNKQCPLDITTNAPAEGEYTYALPDYIPQSVYFMQVVEVCEDGTYCAYGNSTYFNVDMIDDTPTWVNAVSGVLAAIGPITLGGFFLVEQKLRKNKA
jgi:hypothetical protein